MKWLRENWTKVILIVLLLLVGWVWRSNVEKNRDYRESVREYETDISLRKDTINDLKNKLELEKQKVVRFEEINKELDKKIIEKEKIIANKDKELKKEKEKIKDLTSTEQVTLLSENLSNELGKDVNLKLKTIEGDTLVDLEIEHVETINIVFVERNFNFEKLNETHDLLRIKEDKIDTQILLIASHNNSMGLLKKTIEQKDGIIANKDDVIEEMKKKSRRDKVKYFIIGFVSGGAVTLGLTLL